MMASKVGNARNLYRNKLTFLLVKVFQIWKNFTNGSTGQLSAITTFLNLFGTLARIFTTLQDVGDYLILLSFVVSTFLNALLVFQLLYYWNVKKEGDKKD